VNLPRQASLMALGVFIFCYAIYSLSRRGGPAIVSRNWAFFAGFCGGLSGTLFGAGGRRTRSTSLTAASKEQFRATMRSPPSSASACASSRSR